MPTRLTERLAEIDRELASFGKADDVVDDVVRRARAEAPGSLDAVDAVLEGLGTTREVSAQLARPPRAPASRPVETVAPPGAVARPATWDRPERSDPPPDDASGMVELPEELIRREALPPVLELDGGSETLPSEAALAEADAPVPSSDAEAEDESPDTTPPAAQSVRPPALGDAYEDTTDVRDPNSLENAILLSSDEVAAAEPTGEVSIPTRDERRLSGLFDDAPAPSLAPPESPGGIADLFDDPAFADGARPEPEPGAHQDLSDLLGADLQEALAASPGDDGARPIELDGDDEPDRTALFTAEDAQAIRSSLPPRSPDERLDAQLDALVDEPLSPAVELSDMPPSGEFELMIDEDVLVLDDADSDGDIAAASDDARQPRAQTPPPPPSQMPPPPPKGSPPSQPPPKGLMSRLLNRK